MEKPEKILSVDDITFEFEGFLEKHEENLPEGLDPQYMTYIPVLEDPFRNLSKLPQALSRLPMNAVLHQSWSTIFSLYAILLLISLPAFAFIIMASSAIHVDVPLPDNTVGHNDGDIITVSKTAVGVSIVIFIVLGITASFVYLKIIYETLNNLVESKKAPWLVEKMEKSFRNLYQRPWSKRILGISFVIPIFMEIPLGWITLQNTDVELWIVAIWSLFLIIGHIGLSLMVYVSLISLYLVVKNTGIYDLVLSTIIDRVRGYTEGHESILSKKNYEVVGVLSDTPGLSIRSLGDVPIFGLGSALFVVNSIIFLIFTPWFLEGPLVNSVLDINPVLNDQNEFQYVDFGLNLIILGGVILSAIISLATIIRPLIRIFNVMRVFKVKALSELDPFLFDEITGVALRRDTEITNEDQVLFMLRSYIYTMKVSPVHPLRVIQILVLGILYSSRALDPLLAVLS